MVSSLLNRDLSSATRSHARGSILTSWAVVIFSQGWAPAITLESEPLPVGVESGLVVEGERVQRAGSGPAGGGDGGQPLPVPSRHLLGLGEDPLQVGRRRRVRSAEREESDAGEGSWLMTGRMGSHLFVGEKQPRLAFKIRNAAMEIRRRQEDQRRERFLSS